MASLVINGIDIPVKLDDWAEAREDVGERYRTFWGQQRSAVRFRKRRWSGTTPPLDFATAEAVKGLIDGLGHRWSFDADLYSTKGLGLYSSTGTVGVNATAKFGAAGLRIVAGSATWFTGYGGAGAVTWSVSLWRYETATWHHYLVRSDGAKWKDAVRNDGVSTTFLTVDGSTGGIVLSEASTGYLDELVFLPYLAPTTWPALLYARTTPWPSVPQLEVKGDLLPVAGAYLGYLLCEGQTSGSKITQGVYGGTLQPLQAVAFELVEV